MTKKRDPRVEELAMVLRGAIFGRGRDWYQAAEEVLDAVEGEYEYAIKRTSLTGNSEFIVGDYWGDREERETALAGLKDSTAAAFVKYWLVRRRKAGPVQDV